MKTMAWEIYEKYSHIKNYTKGNHHSVKLKEEKKQYH